MEMTELTRLLGQHRPARPPCRGACPRRCQPRSKISQRLNWCCPLLDEMFLTGFDRETIYFVSVSEALAAQHREYPSDRVASAAALRIADAGGVSQIIKPCDVPKYVIATFVRFSFLNSSGFRIRNPFVAFQFFYSSEEFRRLFPYREIRCALGRHTMARDDCGHH